MQKITTVTLNGNAYQLEERAYGLLSDYLQRAHVRLGANPDRTEIMRDIEQSIADRCMRTLGPGKTVVTTADVEQMLREIGPIENGSAAGATSEHDPTRPEASRLYQIREGGLFSGVCNGLGAYFNLDPTIVRVAFVLAAFIEMAAADRLPWMTVGTYVLLVFLVPYARTSEELAAAQGQGAPLPYQVQRVVDRLKSRLAIPGFKQWSVGARDRNVG